MCLEASSFKELKDGKGIGYKIVENTVERNVFHNIWHFFQKDGHGGAKDKEHADDFYTSVLKYKIGRKYKVRHDRIAFAHTDEEYGDLFEKYTYPAGVHLYIERDYARMKMKGFGYSVVAFGYNRAVARDANTIVAMEVEPLEIIESK